MSLDQEVWDVVVLGGGVAGVAAAFEAAGQGRRTLVIERRPALGWEIAWAHAPGAVHGPLADALAAEFASMDVQAGGRVDPAFFEIALNRVLDRAGVSVLLYAQPVRVLVKDKAVHAAVVATKGGMRTFRSRTFVDGSENGLFWRQAGASGQMAVQRGRYSVAFWTGPERPEAEIGDVGQARDVRIGTYARPAMAELSFDVEQGGLIEARLVLPEVLQAVRAPAGPLSAEAVVTHTGLEVLPVCVTPLEGTTGEPHAQADNLYGAGLWLGSAAGAEEAAARLLEAGRSSGAAAAAAAPGQAEPGPAAAGVPVDSAPSACDVIVAGGGTGGALAGIAAARRGCRTIVLELGTCLGGVGSAGGIHSYYYGIAGGLQDEVDARVQGLSPLFGPADRVRGFHPDAKKVALEQLAREAGADVRYGAMLCGVVTETLSSRAPVRLGGPDRALRRVREVVSADADGTAAYRVAVAIDATGDGDLAGWAGAECRFGRPGDGLLHAYTVSAGRVHVGEAPTDVKVGGVNYDTGYVDPTDSEDLTRARRDGLDLYPDGIGPAPTYIAPVLGIRCGRLMVGDQTVTLGDLIRGRRFPDAVLETYGHYDNHAVDYEFESDEAVYWIWMLCHWKYQMGAEIPYGALLPRGLEGILMACRAISVTPDAHHLLRMQKDMQRLGEVAGIAAALAVEAGCSPRALDVTRLQEELIRSGALVPPGTPPRFLALRDEALGQRALPAPEQPQDLEAELSGERSTGALMLLAEAAKHDEGARGILRRSLESEAPAIRLRAAASLALCGDDQSVPVLIQAVTDRQAALEEEVRNSAPAWYAATVLLGRLGAREAVDVLIAVVRDPETPFSPFVAAVRALGRIGDPKAAAALEEAAGREDLRAVQESGKPVGRIHSPRWDRRWQLDLALAEALGRLAVVRKDLVEPYRQDTRAPVRRRADQVMRQLVSEADAM